VSAEELWREGRLSDAIDAQLAEVKASPLDADRRYFLFGLLAFAGDLERASRQLDALGVEDEQMAAGTVPYHNLLAAEAERRRVTSSGGEPLLPDDAPETLRQRVRALHGDGGARAIVDGVVAEEPPITGTCDGDTFESISDTDEVLGPTLEVFAGGRWLLLPFGNVRKLTIREPRHLLDLLWLPAALEDREGTRADVHLPVLYPGTHEASSDEIRLGRSTEWEERDGVTRGVGQRVLFVDTGAGGEGDDRAILAIRELDLGE
jgi:type VI secretion system protein ImpE